MSQPLSVHDLRFEAKGSALTFLLKPGQLMATYGPAGSGKTRFIRSLCGLERNYKGSIRLGVEIALAGYPEPSRRASPESIARKAAGRNGASRVAEALGAAHLWEIRRESIGSLSEGARAAVDLLTALASPAKLIFIDGQFERLDPWTRSSMGELLIQRLSQGVSIVIATSLPEWAVRSDLLLVWKEGKQAFLGRFEDLVRSQGWTEIEVETLHEPAVRALCEPFEVSIESQKGAIRVKARENQAVAARMLLEGYGDVRALIQRRRSAEEILTSL